MKRILFFIIILTSLIATGCRSNIVERVGEPDVYMVDGVDEEMNTAMITARENINIVIDALKDLKNENYISIKVKFEEDQQVEHMWIEGVIYQNNIFEGVLSNEPVYLKNMKIGDKVKIGLDKLSDWMIVDSNGDVIGGYTIRVLRDRMTDEERQEFDSSSGLKFEKKLH